MEKFKKYYENSRSEYFVSNLGNVKKIIKATGETETVALSDNGSGYLNCGCGYVHRAVAELFIDNPLNKKEVNHINGNKKDNRAKNLEWCTRTENVRHALDTGLKVPKKHSEETKRKISEANKGKVISEEQRKKIGDFFRGKKREEHSELMKGGNNPAAIKIKVEFKDGTFKTFETQRECGLFLGFKGGDMIRMIIKGERKIPKRLNDVLKITYSEVI